MSALVYVRRKCAIRCFVRFRFRFLYFFRLTMTTGKPTRCASTDFSNRNHRPDCGGIVIVLG